MDEAEESYVMLRQRQRLGVATAQETENRKWPQSLKTSLESGIILTSSTSERIEGVTQG